MRGGGVQSQMGESPRWLPHQWMNFPKNRGLWYRPNLRSIDVVSLTLINPLSSLTLVNIRLK